MCDKINQMIDCNLIYERKQTMDEERTLPLEDVDFIIPLDEGKLSLHSLLSREN